MILKTFDEIVTVICDAYDGYNAPYKVRRDNSNALYLVFKAIAKGLEVINNVAVNINNKFDPDFCSDFDLASTAKLVGTERLSGSGSGLIIKVTNNSIAAVTLVAGVYQYAHTDTIIFSFTVSVDTLINASTTQEFSSFSEIKGAYPVTAIADLKLVRLDGNPITSGLVFSCYDNAGLIGYPDESNLEFRKRINTNTTRHDTLVELETRIRNLPYIFECKLVFNDTDVPVVIEGTTIPPYYLLMLLYGDPRDEIATIVASSSIFPTVMSDPLKALYVYSDVFASGKYPVYYTSFGQKLYSIKLSYLYDSTLVGNTIVQNTINTALDSYRHTNRFVKYITEDIFYNLINDLNITSLKILDIELSVGGSTVTYVAVPSTQLPILENVVFDGALV